MQSISLFPEKFEQTEMYLKYLVEYLKQY
jgi:hypothetical protein